MDPKGQPVKLLNKPRIKWIMERRPNAGTSLKEEGRATLKTAAREVRAKARLRFVWDLIKGEECYGLGDAREIQRLGKLGMIRACSRVNWVDYVAIVTRMVFNRLKARILRRLILPYV